MNLALSQKFYTLAFHTIVGCARFPKGNSFVPGVAVCSLQSRGIGEWPGCLRACALVDAKRMSFIVPEGFWGIMLLESGVTAIASARHWNETTQHPSGFVRGGLAVFAMVR